MFRNVDGISFEEVTSAGGFGHIQKGHGVSFADLDNDGDQDIYAVLGGAYEGDNYPNVCFENPIFENNWVILNLEGVQSNRSAIGTKLKLDLDNGRTIFYTINTGGSFGANSLQGEIGLGQSELILTLTIIWPLLFIKLVSSNSNRSLPLCPMLQPSRSHFRAFLSELLNRGASSINRSSLGLK